MSLTIAVEGGGLRGAFAVGVLEQLAELLEQPVSHLLATSSGAPNAAYFATGQIAEGVRIWEQRTHGSQLVDFANLVRADPVMKIDELVAVFRSEIPLDAARLRESPTALHIAVTEVESGHNRVIRATPDNVFSLLQAAMAIPFAYGKVVPLEDRHYIDGGFAAPLPIREALELAPAKVLAVLTKPRGHRRRKSALSNWLACSSYADYPHAQAAIRQKWTRYNATMDLIEALEAAGRVLAIRPSVELPVSRLSRSRARILASIELGRRAVREHAAELRAFVDG
ncbi:MAG: patatin family protein [Enhygromyxa sp.]